MSGLKMGEVPDRGVERKKWKEPIKVRVKVDQLVRDRNPKGTEFFVDISRINQDGGG